MNTKDVNPELESDSPVWCSKHGRWECDCGWPDEDQLSVMEQSYAQNEINGGELPLDKVEATCQFYDQLSAQRDKAGTEDVCVMSRVHGPASVSVPLQLDYPAWRLSFSEYKELNGWGMPS